MWKKILVLVGLFSLASISGYVLYLEDIRYSMPTPLPSRYKEISPSTYIEPPHPLLMTKGRPLFIHFFNPHCPCSRFNLEHFQNIVQTFSSSVDFAIVLQIEKENSLKKFKRMDLQLPYLEDANGRIALTYGVYSTPQAVILDKAGRLFYRGNYNKSRFCALKSSEYARMALESLLREEKILDLPVYARIAYGCELPLEDLNQKRNEFLDKLFFDN